MVLLTSPAEASQLRFWQFNAQQNQLVFRTEGEVQPRAELIQNPTRLVIDLPDTQLGLVSRSQTVGGAIRGVRVSQFDAQTTRLVIELSPGYTLDPEAIQIRGLTDRHWVVRLPRLEVQPAEATGDLPSRSMSSADSAVPETTQIDDIRTTSSGIFIQTSGRPAPEINVERDRRRNQIHFDLQNSTISPQLTERDRPVNLRGIRRLQIAPADAATTTRITLILEANSPNWSASPSSLGGVVIVPTGTLVLQPGDRASSSASEPAQVRPSPERPSAPGAIAQIQSISLSPDGNQLLINADRPIQFSSGWDRRAGFRITIPSAQLADQIRGPELDSDSPLTEVRLRQEADNTVIVLIRPSVGVQLGEVNQFSDQQLALFLDRSRFDLAQSRRRWDTNLPLGRVRDGRVRVVIDPGHGGRDPGAVGIANLREKDVVLSVALQAAGILQQQGVQVVMTRTDDRSLELDDRVQMAERTGGDLFVSIHANAISLSRPEVNGLETYFYSPRGEQFARTVHYNLVQSTGMQDRGVRQARFYVLRNTSMPAILVEVGFVTGAQDARMLADPRFRRQLAVAIVRGILQYIQQPY